MLHAGPRIFVQAIVVRFRANLKVPVVNSASV